jgi:hypothetical protein
MKSQLIALGAGLTVGLVLLFIQPSAVEAQVECQPICRNSPLPISGNVTIRGNEFIDGGLTVNGRFTVDAGPAYINADLHVDGGTTMHGNLRMLRAATIPISVCINIDGTYDCNNGFQWNGTTLAVRSGGGTAISINPGSGIMTMGSGYTISIGGGTNGIVKTDKSSGAIDFPSISAVTCSSQTQTLTGAAANDPVACSYPTALSANLTASCFVSATDTVTYRLCNPTAGAIDPASGTFSARIIR